MSKTSYAEKLKDPRWQKKRLEILNRDDWCCQWCCDDESTLIVHHLAYEKGREPWEYDDDTLLTLCENCHETDHAERFRYEKELMTAIARKGFSSCDVERITNGFNNLKIQCAPEVTGSLIEWILTDAVLMHELCARMFEDTQRTIDARRSKEAADDEVV